MLDIPHILEVIYTPQTDSMKTFLLQRTLFHLWPEENTGLPIAIQI